MAVLKWLGKAKLAKVIEGLVKSVEEDGGNLLKLRIQKDQDLQGTNAVLDKIVQKVTKGGGT